MNETEYYFYLWIEYLQLYNKWIKWWEDLYDLFWMQKLREE
jgi:hypothetical protein